MKTKARPKAIAPPPKKSVKSFAGFDLTKTYKWTGGKKNEKFAKQLREARLKVLFHDGAIANCRSDIPIDGTHYLSWIWLKDLEVC